MWGQIFFVCIIKYFCAQFASRLVELRVLASHPSHLARVAELLQHAARLQSLTLEHLQPPNPHSQHMVVKYGHGAVKYFTVNK